MQIFFKKQLLLILSFMLSPCINADNYQRKNMYQQIIPELILKKVNIEQPSETEQKLINACRAASEFGTDYPEVSQETIKAIYSVDITKILSQYARTKTTFGYIGLTKCCAHMTDNIKTLQKRQDLIKHFEKNQEAAQKLSKAFENTATAEGTVLRLFKQIDEKEKQNQEKLDNKVYFSTPGFTQCNENKAILETTSRLKCALPLIPVISMLSMPACLEFITECENNSRLGKATPLLSTLGKAVANSIRNIPSTPSNTFKFFEKVYGCNKPIAGLLTAVILSSNAFNVYNASKEIKECLDLIYMHQKDLLATGHLIKSMEIISKIIAHDPVLKDTMSTEYAKLAELFDPNSKVTSADLKHLINELNSSSFTGNASYLLSKQGKILATHHLLHRIKGELIPYLEAFGDVDAHLAIFTLYQEFKSHPRVTFCLPEFVNSSTPVLEARGFWHPLINPDLVVINDLILGKNSAANLIITGPNAGGKTTSLMSLVINIIFAQSFGIAPSTNLRITPFAKIHSYLDITTNLLEGLSLFAAEVDRSKKLKQSILSCTPNQKTFTIIDELFSGTAPDVASTVGFQFASQLGDMKHSMSIITTHFPRLTALEKETTRFANYKVADAMISSNGAITYPFKLVKGASTQNIAQHMLEHEGII